MIDIIVHKKREILETCSRHGATNVRVFGSCARDDYSDESDVDILVSLNTNKTGWEYTAVLDEIAEELQQILHHKVDVWSERMLKPQVLKRAIQEAIAL